MHARDRRYPRSYDSEGYAPDSTDSTEVDMNAYEVYSITILVSMLGIVVAALFSRGGA